MSAKSLDKKNRFRSKTIGFGVSAEEWEEIEQLVALSGMSKQDYIMDRLQNNEMVIQANPRVVKALKCEIQILWDKINDSRCRGIDNSILERLNNIFSTIKLP